MEPVYKPTTVILSSRVGCSVAITSSCVCATSSPSASPAASWPRLNDPAACGERKSRFVQMRTGKGKTTQTEETLPLAIEKQERDIGSKEPKASSATNEIIIIKACFDKDDIISLRKHNFSCTCSTVRDQKKHGMRQHAGTQMKMSFVKQSSSRSPLHVPVSTSGKLEASRTPRFMLIRLWSAQGC
eukprot:964167-Pelagomonas_calceolata.AAC.1